jgi:outer membrane receptor protein involved in Fe transport
MDASYSSGPLSLNGALAYTDAKTKQNLCLFDDPTFACADEDNLVSAPKGTRLPITPRFKISGTARYTVPVGDAKGYAQVGVAHQSSAASDIRTAVFETFSGNVINPAELLGRLEQFSTVSLALGAEFKRYTFEIYASNLFDERGEISRFQACGSCGQRPYIVTITPRTVGVRLGAKF